MAEKPQAVRRRAQRIVELPPGVDASTPAARAWWAFRRLIGLEPRLENETPQSLRDTIEAEGFNAWQMGQRIASIRRPYFGPDDDWLDRHAHYLITPGVPAGQNRRDRTPGEDG